MTIARIMAALFSFALMCASTTTSEAKTDPAARVAVDSSTVTEDAVIYAGPIGAALETGYFAGTKRKFGAESDRCHMRLYFSDRPLQLARSCE